jgi:hypothetical protein
MKRLVIEEEILKLPNDNKWEYAVINGAWNAKKIGSSNWINIEKNPKVKNPTKATDLLNKTFPNAKSQSLPKKAELSPGTSQSLPKKAELSPGTSQSLPKKAELLPGTSQSSPEKIYTHKSTKTTQQGPKPLDINESIILYFGNNNFVTLYPSIKDLSSKIIKFLNVDTSKSGNSIKIPDSKGFYCKEDKSYYIFSDGNDYDTDVCNGGGFDTNYMTKRGIFIINKNYNTPTFHYGTYAESPKNIKEGNLKLTIKKILKEEIQNKK